MEYGTTYDEGYATTIGEQYAETAWIPCPKETSIYYHILPNKILLGRLTR